MSVLLKVKGFSIIEMLISMFIGALILGGVIVTYISMRDTTRDTMVIGEMQETGRLTLSILRRDIEQVGFWGTFYGNDFTNDNSQNIGITPINPDCAPWPNNGSFPQVNNQVFFTSMFAVRTNGNALGCVNNAINDTDVLQVKFLEGVQVAAADQVNTNRYYFLSELENVVFIRGNNVTFPLTGLSTSITDNGLLWPYSHHVYYIRNDTIRINNQDRAVPTLRRKRLNNTAMIDEVVMEGVENIRYNFGIDSNADGRVDTYLTPELMTQTNWQNDNTIVTVQIFILVRSLEPDPFLNLTNRTYQLGNGANNRITFLADDNFRRTVFSTTIQLNNMGARAW